MWSNFWTAHLSRSTRDQVTRMMMSQISHRMMRWSPLRIDLLLIMIGAIRTLSCTLPPIFQSPKTNGVTLKVEDLRARTRGPSAVDQMNIEAGGEAEVTAIVAKATTGGIMRILVAGEEGASASGGT